MKVWNESLMRRPGFALLCGLLLLFLSAIQARGLALTDSPKTAGTARSKSRLEVVVLLDRSPSANNRLLGGEPFVDKLAREIRSQVVGFSELFGFDLFFGSANFGGILGKRCKLEMVGFPSLPCLPSRETIAFTDFRVPLAYSLRLFSEASPPRDERPVRRMVFVISDCEPQLTKDRMTESEKRFYFKLPLSTLSVTKDKRTLVSGLFAVYRP